MHPAIFKDEFFIYSSMKYFYTLLFSLTTSIYSFAGIGTYYNGIDSNLSCSNFKTALTNLISIDAHLPYGKVDESYNRTDLKPAEAPLTGMVIVDRYCSDIPNAFDSCNYRYNDSITPGVHSFCFFGGTPANYCGCYAKEHTFPSSWFNGDQYIRSDMHFVWPADGKTNSLKSNFPLGYVRDVPSSVSYNGTKIGRSNAALNYGYFGARDTLDNNINKTYNFVFEPIDEFKGDFARAYLYVATRYGNQISSWKNNDSIAYDVISNTSYTGLEPWILKLCVKWHKQDPPSSFERKRNDSVQAIQGNRNPYIDFPGWVEKVFGVDGNATACVNTAISNFKTINFSLYPNPVNGDALYINFERIISAPFQVDIVDMLGNIVQSQNYKSPSTSLLLDVNDLPKGIYLISILYNQERNTLRFIKE